MSFKIQGINHVGLAPKDSAKARWFFETALQLAPLGEELVLSQKTNTVMYPSGVGSDLALSRLEILEPQAGEADSPIAKFLEKKGSGIHHVALAVDDVEAAIKHLLSLGVKMIDQAPRPGAHKTRIAFVHPESTGGLLVELVQETH